MGAHGTVPELFGRGTRSDVALPSDATVVSVKKLTLSNASTAEIVKPRVLARISRMKREGRWPCSASVDVMLVGPHSPVRSQNLIPGSSIGPSRFRPSQIPEGRHLRSRVILASVQPGRLRAQRVPNWARNCGLVRLPAAF
jgi:hypothetical protein